MGIAEYFNTLVRNDITYTSIKSNYLQKMLVNHLFIDFNSIIHVSGQKIIAEIDIFLQMVLKNLYQERTLSNMVFTEKFKKYRMVDIQSKINKDTDPNEVVALFHEHFTVKVLDKLIITLVINTLLGIIRTYCQNNEIKTLLLAIDGVPSKSKMLEQKQRRYMSTIIIEYKKKILHEYKDYLLEQEDYIYIALKNGIKWSRGKITPGTAFMHKLVGYLKSESIQTKIKTNRSQMNIIISDMYEIGEGEKR